jgi:hypothetical protein
MKKLFLIVMLGFSAIATNALAATAAGNFSVNITLTSKCEINTENAATGAVIGDLALAYTSFQTSASTGSTSFDVRCTTGEVIETMSLDSASVTDGTTGIAYTLALSTSATHTVGPVASLTNQTAASTGTTFHVHGNAIAGQAGTITAGTANKVRTLTITY